MVAPLLVCNLPGTFVTFWEIAVVLRLDRPELWTVLPFMSFLTAMIAASVKYELPCLSAAIKGAAHVGGASIVTMSP